MDVKEAQDTFGLASEKPTGVATRTDPIESPTPVSNPQAEFLPNRWFKARPDTKAAIHLLDDTGKDSIDPMRNFFLNSISGMFAERYQILEMYDGLDITLLGERPVTLQIAMTLYNNDNCNWRDQWMYLWANMLRATKVVENNMQFVIVADNLILEGYPLSYSFSETGTNDNSIPISLQMVCAPDRILPIALYADSAHVPADLKGLTAAQIQQFNAGLLGGYYANGTATASTRSGWDKLYDSVANWLHGV